MSTSLFIACALDSLHSAASDGVGFEEGTERVGVVRHFTTLFLHLMRILNLLSHVIDHRPLEGKESKVQCFNIARCDLNIPFVGTNNQATDGDCSTSSQVSR